MASIEMNMLSVITCTGIFTGRGLGDQVLHIQDPVDGNGLGEGFRVLQRHFYRAGC